MVTFILLVLSLLILIGGIKLVRKGKRWFTLLGIILIALGALATYAFAYNLFY